MSGSFQPEMVCNLSGECNHAFNSELSWTSLVKTGSVALKTFVLPNVCEPSEYIIIKVLTLITDETC